MSRHFDPVRIERELVQLEREKSSTGVRTTLFNLVVFVPKTRQDSTDGIMSYLLGKRAARIIKIVTGNEGETRVSVSARCVPDHEDRGICFQEILIDSGADGAGTAPGTWSSLLIRDIPVYILWLDRVIGNEGVLAYAEQHADKLVLDSDDLVVDDSGFSEVYRRLAALYLRTEVAVADFAWSRYAGLRGLAAQLFDEAGRTDQLGDLDSVKVEGGGAAAARLFFLWLAAQLEWEVSTGTFTAGTRPVLCDHRPDPGKPLGLPSWIRFGLNGGDMLEIRVDGGIATLSINSEELSRRVAADPGSGELMMREVDTTVPDSLYYRALQAGGIG